MTEGADILICGGGILGLAITKELLKKGYENIVILEKEEDIGKHASGRNSGILHAGIYYSQDSLKAKFCFEGNLLMKGYCREKGIPIAETGKVIVAKNESELSTLKELYNRAVKNNVKVDLIDSEGLKKIEPYAKTHRLALFSPHTAVIDPKEILHALESDIVASQKVKIIKNCRFEGLNGDDEAVTSRGNILFSFFINTSGAYSDRVAHSFGVGMQYKILPFKGTYKKINKVRNYLVRGNIYPVPDLRNPFLGVHLTRAIDGTVYIGPTAIPAFGRENYGMFEGLGTEAFDILYRDVIFFITNSEFRNVALTESKKLLSKHIFEDVRAMVDTLQLTDIEPCDKVGIRPQLIDWEKKKLVMDFIILKNGKAIHILNAVSPAFTSSMSFSRFVVDSYVN